MDENLTTLQKLDLILNYLKANETIEVTVEMIGKDLNVDRIALGRLLGKLIEEKYVINTINLSLSVEGDILQQTGGFRGMILRSQNELALIENARERQRFVEDEMIINTGRLNSLTLGLLIATAFLVLLALASLLLPYFLCQKTC